MFAEIIVPQNLIKCNKSKFHVFWWLMLANLAVITSIGIITKGAGLVLAPIILIIGGISPFISLYFSRWLAKRAYSMQMISRNDNNPSLRELYVLIDTLRQKVGIQTMPEVAIYESGEMNAFATGANRNSALIAFSSALLQRMNAEEIAAVAAHEIAHIANGDMIILSIVQSVVNAISMLITIPLWIFHLVGYTNNNYDYIADLIMYAIRIIVTVILMFLGNLVVNLFSRRREFAADLLAAELLNKDFMISALRRLESDDENLEHDKTLVAYNALKINSYLSSLGEVFSTHPSIERRISALQLAPIHHGGAYLGRINHG